MTDKQAAEEYLQAHGRAGGSSLATLDAFLAGATHVRTSAEWKALVAVVEAARMGAFHHSACRWHYSGECCCAKEEVTQALQELDRIRKKGESE